MKCRCSELSLVSSEGKIYSQKRKHIAGTASRRGEGRRRELLSRPWRGGNGVDWQQPAMSSDIDHIYLTRALTRVSHMHLPRLRSFPYI